MNDAFTQRFVELLTADAENCREAAEAWEELERHGSRLEDLEGKLVATAAEMVQRHRARERELRQHIERMRRG